MLVYALEYTGTKSITCTRACKVPILTQLCWATRLVISSSPWSTVDMTVSDVPRIKMKKTTTHNGCEHDKAFDVVKETANVWLLPEKKQTDSISPVLLKPWTETVTIHIGWRHLMLWSGYCIFEELKMHNFCLTSSESLRNLFSKIALETVLCCSS